jgi:hypothetical protein
MINANSGGKVPITPEIKARIEENRRIALEKLKTRRLNLENNPARNFQNKILPTKEIQSSAAGRAAAAPYVKPTTNKAPTAAVASHSSAINNPKKRIKCEFYLENDMRFLVKCQYDDEVMRALKTLKTGKYGKSTEVLSQASVNLIKFQFNRCDLGHLTSANITT